MLFVIDNLKYDTVKMKLISTKCEYRWKGSLTGLYFDAREVKLFRSDKGRWLLVYEEDYKTVGRAMTEEEVKNLLKRFDIDAYEKMFGELEEA